MTTALAMQRVTLPTPSSAGGRLVATDGRPLPLAGARLTADARGGLLSATLEQRFRNVHPEPLTVTYLFPLPHGGAVSGFAFQVGGRRVTGEVDRLADARRRFEEAVLEGRSAALLEQERGSVFTQAVGNVPPGEEVTVELRVDQRLDWRDGAWEWRFPTALAPRYLGAEGRVPDAGRVEVEVAEGDLPARLHLSLAVRDPLPGGATPASPSHALRFTPGDGSVEVRLGAEEGAALDRDLVVRWRVAAPAAGLSLDAFRAPAAGRLAGRAFGLLTLVPPAAVAGDEALARDLVLLVDTSGSMDGRPLDQARAVLSALVETLGERDSLEMISFGSRPVRWRSRPAAVTAPAKAEALRWLAGLQAAGGTEMRDGILEALRPLRGEAQRQVVLVTDGLVGFEQEVVAAVRAGLPRGSRVHAVGVGEAVNRSLTGPVARAGRGLEVVLGLDDAPGEAAAALSARTALPLVTDLAVEGPGLAAPAGARLPDLFGGAPALLPVELAPQGGALVVRGVGPRGPFERRLEVPATEPGRGSPALAALFGREAVEELELARAAGDTEGIDAAVEALGLAFQLATRRTSWVAVSEEPTVDPGVPIRRERMPQALPLGMSAEGLGLRSRVAAMPLLSAPMASGFLFAEAPSPESKELEPPSLVRRLFQAADAAPPAPPQGAPKGKKARAAEPSLGALGGATYAWVGRRLVITLRAGAGGLEWELPRAVSLREAGGGSRTLAVVVRGSTRTASVPAGGEVRLVLDWSWPWASRPPLSELELALGGTPFLVPLREA